MGKDAKKRGRGMTGRKSSDRASIEKRRDAVLKYRIRQAKPYEIAKTLNISLTTVYRDLEELNQSLVTEINRARIRPIKLALFEIEERERELWKLHDQPPPKPKKQGQDPKDDRFVKIAIMDRLLAIWDRKNKLVGLEDIFRLDLQQEKETEDEMSEDEYDRLREAMFKRAGKSDLLQDDDEIEPK